MASNLGTMTTRDVQVATVAERDAVNAILTLAFSGDPATRRALLEEALRRSEAQYRALFEGGLPTMAFEIPMLALLGAAAVTFAATINSTLQLAVAPEMRGRVMALYSVVFLGSTPIGGPLTGWLAETYDPRVALLLAGITGLSAAWAAHVSFARLRQRASREAHPLRASVS